MGQMWAWNSDRVIIRFCISHDNKSPGDDGGRDFWGHRVPTLQKPTMGACQAP